MLDRLLSRTGPEVPPDVVVPPPVIDEPTDKFTILPTIPQRVAGRAVIVYEQAPRRPWRLWGFSAVLVALTIGVVLGQAEAFQPTSRAAVVPQQPAAPPAGPVSAPLGSARALVFEVTGEAPVLHIASADLGDQLYSVLAIGPSPAPRVTDSPQGPRLELAGGAEVRLSVKVAWTVRLDTNSSDQDIDVRAGGLATVELAGRSSRVALSLPRPKATVKLAVTGTVNQLRLATVGPVPVRLRLTRGAPVAVLDGRTYRKVKPGATLTATGWTGTIQRYEVTAVSPLGSVTAGRL